MRYSSNDGPGFWGWVSIIAIFCVILFSFMRGCSEQSMARSWGGTMDVALEPNQKLVNVTWKDNSLWILTKDMCEEDVAEHYTFYEKDTIGMLEGSAHINEVKMNEEEYAAYQEQQTLALDYNKNGNIIFDDDKTICVFIEYDAENDVYIKLKDYTYDENGGLIAID